MGETASAEYNQAANKSLEEDIQEMKIVPRAWWHSYGFNINEGWREDGFSLAFDPAERQYARQAVLKLAKKYKQAAVYVYTFKDGTVVREVLWVSASKHAAMAKEGDKMEVLSAVPASPLAARQWRP